MNKTVKKTVDEKLAMLKERVQDLTVKQTSLNEQLADVNKQLAEVQSEIDDLNAFLAEKPPAK